MTHSQTVGAGSLVPVFTISLTLLSSSFLVGCSDDDSNLVIAPGTYQALQGNWVRVGYGTILSIAGNDLTVFEATSATCHLRDAGHVEDFFDGFSDFHIDDNVLYLSDSQLGTPSTFNRVDTLPVVCDDPIGNLPTEQFDHVWHTFNDYYAFFGEREVDWIGQYDQWRPTLTKRSSDEELAEALIGLVTPIDDNHVGLKFDDDNAFDPAQPKGFVQALIDEFESQSLVSDEATYIGGVLDQWRADIQATYIGSSFQTLRGVHAGLLEWGMMGDSVGFLSINQFFADLEQSEANELVFFDQALDRILAELADTQAMIIDVRIAPGGRDAVALAIANRFADTERLAATKTTRTHVGEGNSQSLIVRPSERTNYENPIILITSGFSVSATEVFTLLMRSLPHVTHLGEPTNGALSDRLDKELPNGWEFTLSNEVYRDTEGNAYEVVGIPATVTVPILSKVARDRNEDSAINAAFDALALPNPAAQ